MNNKTRNNKKKKKTTRKNMRGGTWYGLASGPVGCSWQGGSPSTWPGVAGKVGQSNYYQLSPNGVPAGYFDPPISSSNVMKMKGGSKNRKYKKTRKGKRRKNVGSTRRKKGGCGCSTRPMIGGTGLIRSRIFPADFVNAYRSVVNAPSRWMNMWGGVEQPANINVSPTNQPIDKPVIPNIKVGSRIPSGQTSTSAKSYVTSSV